MGLTEKREGIDPDDPEDEAGGWRMLADTLSDEDGLTGQVLPWLMALAGVIMIVAALIVGEQSLQGGARTASLNTMNSILDGTVLRFEEWVNGRRREVRVWSQTTAVSDALEALETVDGDEQALIEHPAQQALQVELQPWINEQGYAGYYLADAGGRIVASNRSDLIGRAVWGDQSSHDLAGATAGGPVITPPIRSSQPSAFGRTGGFLIHALDRVPGPDGEVAAGFFGLMLDPSGDYATIFRTGVTGNSGDTYAIDSRGALITRSRYESELVGYGLLERGETSLRNIFARDPGVDLSRAPAPPENLAERPFTLAARSVMAGERGHDLRGYRDYRGVAVIGSWVWLDTYDIGVITEVDITEAYAGVGQAQAVLRVFGLAMCGLVVAAAILFSMHRNITQRRQAAVVEAERKFRQILMSAGEGIYGLDAQGRATFVNPAACRMLGFHEEELIGKDMHAMVHHSLRDGAPFPVEECDVHRIGASESRYDGADEVLWTKSGDPLHVAIVSTPILRDGELDGAVVTFSDISQRRRDEAALRRYARELKRSNAELQDFAYAASHDLQEPLRKIQAFGERLNSKYGMRLEDTGQLYLSRMVDAATRMRRLIDDLLSYSRVNTRSTAFLPVNLNSVMSDVLSDLEPRIAAQDAKVRVGDLPAVEADPGQIHQLFQNLVGNALKFSRPGVKPSVTIEGSVEAGEEGAVARIAIADNGIGFDPKHAERVFGMFERLHSREDYDGTGVGLATCRKIADRHGGKLTAWAEPGAGAVFTLVLPIRQAVSV